LTETFPVGGSGREGLRVVTVVGLLDFCWGEVTQFAVEAFGVELCDPSARLDLEVVDACPVASVAGEHGRIAVKLGLVEADDGFGHGVDAPICQDKREGPLEFKARTSRQGRSI
jgi:hypothetical protein